MSHASPDPDHTSPTQPLPSSRGASSNQGIAKRGAMMGATVLISGFIFLEAPVLYHEWKALQVEWEQDAQSRPIGFVGIAPNPSYARPPQPWLIKNETGARVWAGWVPGVGHRWFEMGSSDLEMDQLFEPIGRDVVRAIDQPICEASGGEIWNRMLPSTPVATFSLDTGVETAYPLLLLKKVEVVNDTVQGKPLLVVHTPFLLPEQAVTSFDPVLNGKRLAMGLSGIMMKPGPQPLLYDTETESLWVVHPEGLDCVAGDYRGSQLRRLKDPVLMEWEDWTSQHPDGRLIVGAIRKRAAEKAPPETSIH